MQIGDTIIIRGIVFTIWFIENGIYHVKDAEDNGYCGNEEWLININEA